mmetsp:Transcript_49568/g.153020  ORF Transcript_49568/g.153020 Transcript_49568/m.153020 type:complete len:329 (-) Transcript_49568:190-1176(-)
MDFCEFFFVPSATRPNAGRGTTPDVIVVKYRETWLLPGMTKPLFSIFSHLLPRKSDVVWFMSPIGPEMSSTRVSLRRRIWLWRLNGIGTTLTNSQCAPSVDLYAACSTVPFSSVASTLRSSVLRSGTLRTPPPRRSEAMGLLNCDWSYVTKLPVLRSMSTPLAVLTSSAPSRYFLRRSAFCASVSAVATTRNSCSSKATIGSSRCGRGTGPRPFFVSSLSRARFASMRCLRIAAVASTCFPGQYRFVSRTAPKPPQKCALSPRARSNVRPPSPEKTATCGQRRASASSSAPRRGSSASSSVQSAGPIDTMTATDSAPSKLIGCIGRQK